MKRLCYLWIAIVLIGAARAQWTQTAGIPDGAYLKQIIAGKSGLFAGTYMGVYRSKDEGATWHALTNGITDAPVRGMGVLQGRIFAATDSGLYLSLDEGESWAKSASWKATGYTPWKILVLGSDIFVGSWSLGLGGGNGVYRSRDLGQTWTQASQGPRTNVFSLAAIGNVLLIGTNAVTYRSTDSGATWISSPTGANRDIVEDFAVSGNLVFAGTYQNGVYQSSDSGLTWKRSGSVFSPTVRCMGAAGSLVFAGTADGIEMSANGGRSWSLFNEGYTPGDISGMGLGGAYLFAANAGPIFRRPLSELPASIVRREKPKERRGFRKGIPLLEEFDIRGRRIVSLAE